jgi:AcrR family transcriptional regulator
MQRKTARKTQSATATRTRNRLLDEAERIVARDGVRALTFESLAAAAKSAKGTVLYHFESKEELAGAMIERFVQRFDAAWGRLIASDKSATGRSVRAYLVATHGPKLLTGRNFDRVNAAMTAALAYSPRHLDPVRKQGKAHQTTIEGDGLDKVTATIIRLAVDGLWFTESLGLMRYDKTLKKEVLARLTGWTNDADMKKPKTRRRK